MQFCDWHVFQNIRKRLAKKRYTKEEREAILKAAWSFIKSMTQEELAKNRRTFYLLLKAGEVSYIENT
jgi:hypothetical protein